MTDLTRLTSSTGDALSNPNEWTSADLLRGLPTRLHTIYEATTATNPLHPAFVENGITWSYRDFASSVDAVAARLVALGIRPGDRVMIVSENSVAASALVLAASKIDAWAVVANPRLSPRELDQIHEHNGARRRFFMCSISPEASSHANRCGADRSQVGPYHDIGIGALNERAAVETVHADGSRQVAVLIYTSGTTGMPDLSAFRRNGGKILLFHGLSDQIIPAQSTADYYRRVVAEMGQGAVSSFLKFYELPGTAHSGFGVTFNPTWDALGALDTWVVKGAPPKSPTVTYSHFKPGRTRPLCQFPSRPK